MNIFWIYVDVKKTYKHNMTVEINHNAIFWIHNIYYNKIKKDFPNYSKSSQKICYQ